VHTELLYVRTKTGQVRCAISVDTVTCERNSANGFPQAPKSATGPGNWNLAAIDTAGRFAWNEGNIGATDPATDMVLEYGQQQRLMGWVIEPSSDGTRFTSNATGRGMFVSVQNVYGF
jgi:hypothetical protein